MVIDHTVQQVTGHEGQWDKPQVRMAQTAAPSIFAAEGGFTAGVNQDNWAQCMHKESSLPHNSLSCCSLLLVVVLSPHVHAGGVSGPSHCGVS
jgi:hypothetical protein